MFYDAVKFLNMKNWCTVARHWSKWTNRKHHCQEMGWRIRGRLFHVYYLIYSLFTVCL